MTHNAALPCSRWSVYWPSSACCRLCCCRLFPTTPHVRVLQAYALQAATLLKADRNAAIRRGTDVATLVDPASRVIVSGAGKNTLRVPEDVHFDATLPKTCNQKPAFSTISFFANGMSCGGSIALTRFDTGYEVRVNWLTGRVEIVPRNAASR